MSIPAETTTTAEATAAPVDLPTPIIGSLSPSRASDFKTCPLLYRFRVIDRLPEKPSSAAVRGTLVHSVLEQLFDLPAAERTSTAARAMVDPEWAKLTEADPEIAALFAPAAVEPAAQPAVETDPPKDSATVLAEWLESARDLVSAYFELEDPRRLEPAAREELVEAVLDDGVLLRGYVDRLDVAPTGEIRVVDYKTGAAPREMFEAKALFQMKFYALVLWRARGVIPRQLKLIYLSNRDTLTYSPEEAELQALQRQLGALWSAISRAMQTGDFRPNPSRLCDWCDHHDLCPAKGGTPPPYPSEQALAVPVDRRISLTPADRRADQD